MRFTLPAIAVAAVLLGTAPVRGQSLDGPLQRVASRNPIDDDFLPLPDEPATPEDTWWNRWKPPMPKLQAPKMSMPKLTMPSMELPDPSGWVKKVNNGTRSAMTKTKRTLTAPWRAMSGSKRTTRKKKEPGFWSRIFTVEEDPPPSSVRDFLSQPRPGYGG